MNTRKIKLIAVVCLLILTIVWILQNRAPVQTRFLFVTVTMPQSALLAVTLLTGIATGMLLALEKWMPWQRKSGSSEQK
ncbi:MAG: LapA family protein [Kiritimatiellia bacterium]